MKKSKRKKELILADVANMLKSSNSFLKFAQEKPQIELWEAYESFLSFQKQFDEELERAVLKFMMQPLFPAFLAWAIGKKSFDANLIENALILLNKGYIHIVNENGDFLKIVEAKNINHNVILDHIRMSRDLSLEKREGLVTVYLSFYNWLSDQSFGLMNPLNDPDEIKRVGRVLTYPLFVKLHDQLDDKAQVVAKLLYFGGSRTLEEVLDLQINDVDFTNRLIRFDSQMISYPLHVLLDIKAITSNRSSGRVFVGRSDAPLNPATIFRNFKEAASKVGIGPSFSPKLLTTNG